MHYTSFEFVVGYKVLVKKYFHGGEVLICYATNILNFVDVDSVLHLGNKAIGSFQFLRIILLLFIFFQCSSETYLTRLLNTALILMSATAITYCNYYLWLHKHTNYVKKCVNVATFTWRLWDLIGLQFFLHQVSVWFLKWNLSHTISRWSNFCAIFVFMERSGFCTKRFKWQASS